MYDVTIIGGGPAGSTAAGLLACAGRRVILFEREKFPRFHIGESLLPFSMKAFSRLGLHEEFLRGGFPKKYGGEIVSACSDMGTKFYFKDGYRSQTDHAYQVTRGDFDTVLLDHAAESGAEVCEETTVDGVELSKDAVDLAVRSNGTSHSTRGALSCRCQRTQLSPRQTIQNQALAEQPTIAKRMINARKVSKVYVEADFSYRSAHLHGDRWLLTGDAAGFLDPIFSSGVFLAVFSGEKCADALNEVLNHPRKSKRLFGRYERSVNRAMDVCLRFVNACYTKEFIEVFLAPRNVLGLAPAVNAVLGGNVGNSFQIRGGCGSFIS